MGLKKIKIAAIFSAEKEIGGGYSQGVEDLKWFSALASRLDVELTVLTFNRRSCQSLNDMGINAKYFRMNFLDKVFNEIYCKVNIPQIAIAFRKLFSLFLVDARLKKNNFDLVYFSTHNRVALYLFEINFIMTVMDVCHVDNPWAPEIRKNKRFERREELNTKASRRAFAIIFESQSGKENFIRSYSIHNDKCFVIPFHVKKVNNKKILTLESNHYIFYPAQYWPHKNHAYVIEAIAKLREKFKVEMKAIFCGSDPESNKSYLKKIALEFGVDDLVDFKDFVTDEELSDLYSNSFAVVMTTYFGPTNLPPVEAMQYGKPILYSDIPGAFEQLGNAALYLNLKEPDDLAEKLKRLLTERAAYDKLVSMGQSKLEEINSFNRDSVMESIIRAFARVRCTWN